MSRNGEVVVLVRRFDKNHLEMVSYTLGEQKLREIGDLGSI